MRIKIISYYPVETNSARQPPAKGRQALAIEVAAPNAVRAIADSAASPQARNALII